MLYSVLHVLINNKYNNNNNNNNPATSLAEGAEAEKAASLKTNKYEDLQTTHLFVPIAIETSGYFNTTGL